MEARSGIVRGADPADLALAHERVERAERLVERRPGVVAVRVVEVDAVDAEAGERRVAAGPDALGREARGERRGREPDLRRDDHLVATAALVEPRAEDRLGLAALVPGDPRAVDVRGVDEVAARGAVRVEHGEARVAVGRPAEDVAAEAERVDGQIGRAEASTRGRGVHDARAYHSRSARRRARGRCERRREAPVLGGKSRVTVSTIS